MSAQEDYRVLVDFCQSSDMKKAPGLCRRESCIKVAELVAYFSVLVWRVVGLALFSVHVTDCLFREKHASYQCNNFTLFSHAYELEIAWQASSILNTLIVLAVLVKAFGVQECLSALRNNSKHARFWSLFFQLVGTFISKIVVISTVPPVVTILIEVGYVFMVVSTTLVVYFWNGIPAPFKATYIRVPGVIRAARAAYVISLLVFILEYFFLFIITTAQAAFQVTGLHSNSDGNYSTIHILAVVLNFTEASFHYAMVKFFWNKLFDDRKNLLVNDNV